MGVRNLKPKQAMPKITLGIASGLARLLPNFKTQTFADHQRIDSVLKTLQSTQAVQQEIITSFFKKHNLPETEVIDGQHPLSRPLFEQINQAETKLEKKDVAKFTLEELNAGIDGLSLAFADRNFLMYWLVKAEGEKLKA